MRHLNLLTLLTLIALLSTSSCVYPDPPTPCGPIPSARQLAWQELEFYAFVHFNMNTFTNMEWGYGDEDPDTFRPTNLDTRQWARVCKEAGMRGIIITAKHHDGFCLWPSAYTEHSVKSSVWRDGQGDVLRELADACEEFGLKLGIYLSPWDRNHPDYGTPAYLDYFRNQLRELLTQYGDIFEVWFDGANGGTGYYGGANEERRVDKRSYYDWPNTYALIRELQPNAVIFSDAGPDIRWIGNEHGYAYPTTWSTLMRDSVYGGMPEYASQWAAGQENGSHWVPGEVDVSIRPGWYYHPYEDHKVKSLSRLLDIYYQSLGRNASLLLNLPVDTRGMVAERDAEQLRKLATKIREDFALNLARDQPVNASHQWGIGFGPANLVDGAPDTYWAAHEDSLTATLTLSFNQPTRLNRFLAKEPIALGQRIKAFQLEGRNPSGTWEEIARETTIGYQRILRFQDRVVTGLRLTILDAKCPPTLSEIQAFWAPPILEAPRIRRDSAGLVQIDVPSEGTEVYYTMDGSEPSAKSNRYQSPFSLDRPVLIKAIGFHPASGRGSEAAIKRLDVPKTNWQVAGGEEDHSCVIDGDLQTWTPLSNTEGSGTITIDLGATYTLKGFTYLPMQARANSGLIQSYTFYTRRPNGRWSRAARGEFGNIQNSPVEQQVTFDERPARFIRLQATRTVAGDPPAAAEIGVITSAPTE